MINTKTNLIWEKWIQNGRFGEELIKDIRDYDSFLLFFQKAPAKISNRRTVQNQLINSPQIRSFIPEQAFTEIDFDPGSEPDEDSSSSSDSGQGSGQNR